jgi:chitosanase
MDSFQRLLDYDLWTLPLPIVVRNLEINLQTLAAAPPHSYSGPAPGTRALAMQGQVLRGLDVRLFQLGLSEAGCNVIADGAFGKNSLDALHAYQQSKNLPLCDIADATLVETLAHSVA